MPPDITSLAECMMDILGETGPITVDTEIAKRMLSLEDDIGVIEAEDIMVIGKEDEQITEQDIKNFLSTVNHRCNKKIFNNERCYDFGGVFKTTDKSYRFSWNS